MRQWPRSAVLCGLLPVLAVSCGSGDPGGVPGLEPAGTVMTKVRPTRQDMSDRISLAARVVMDPVYGLVAPEDGRIEYVADVGPGVSARPVTVAHLVTRSRKTPIRVPAGSTFAGRLVADRIKVTAGMPVVAVRHNGYGIVADIDADKAYKVTDRVRTAQAQIKNGPGPFECTVLGTIAALPAGTVPDPPRPGPEGPGDQAGDASPTRSAGPSEAPKPPSEPTGMRLNCMPPATITLINGTSATIEVDSGKRPQALVVPVEAVAGRQGRGRVDVLDATGGRRTTEVTLGLTDGRMIEVLSGLTGEETLAVPGPDLATAPPSPGSPSTEGP